MVSRFGAIPGIGHVPVSAGVELIEQELYFLVVVFIAGYPLHFGYHIGGHGIYYVELLQVGSDKLPGPLFADINTVQPGYFLRQVVGGFADVVAIGAGAVYLPVEPRIAGLLLQYSLGEGASANIAEAYHQDFHGIIAVFTAQRYARKLECGIYLPGHLNSRLNFTNLPGRVNFYEMSMDPQDSQRKNYILRRSIMDYGMGALIAGSGLFFAFSKKLGYAFDIDPVLRDGFAVLCFIYGGFRMYRGYKKNYFSE